MRGLPFAPHSVSHGIHRIPSRPPAPEGHPLPEPYESHSERSSPARSPSVPAGTLSPKPSFRLGSPPSRMPSLGRQPTGGFLTEPPPELGPPSKAKTKMYGVIAEARRQSLAKAALKDRRVSIALAKQPPPVHRIKSLTDAEKRACAHHFQTVQGGVNTLLKLQALVNMCGQELAVEELEQLLEEVGFAFSPRHRNNIGLDTFTAVMQALKARHVEALEDPELETVDAFVAMGGNADRTGHVDSQALVRAMASLGLVEEADGDGATPRAADARRRSSVAVYSAMDFEDFTECLEEGDDTDGDSSSAPSSRSQSVSLGDRPVSLQRHRSSLRFAHRQSRMYPVAVAGLVKSRLRDRMLEARQRTDTLDSQRLQPLPEAEDPDAPHPSCVRLQQILDDHSHKLSSNPPAQRRWPKHLSIRALRQLVWRHGELDRKATRPRGPACLRKFEAQQEAALAGVDDLCNESIGVLRSRLETISSRALAQERALHSHTKSRRLKTSTRSSATASTAATAAPAAGPGSASRRRPPRPRPQPDQEASLPPAPAAHCHSADVEPFWVYTPPVDSGSFALTPEGHSFDYTSGAELGGFAEAELYFGGAGGRKRPKSASTAASAYAALSAYAVSMYEAEGAVAGAPPPHAPWPQAAYAYPVYAPPLPEAALRPHSGGGNPQCFLQDPQQSAEFFVYDGQIIQSTPYAFINVGSAKAAV